MKSLLGHLPAILTLALSIALPVSAQDLGDRIIPNDPANYRLSESAHDGAGPMEYTGLIGRNDMATNFLYLHAGRILPEGGIGHHFHHSIEEMYVLLSGEAEFTINGHTSVLEAPVVVPNKLGSSHGLVNTSDEPLRWLNFAVSEVKGQGDAFDLGDNRVGADLDPVPVFVYGKLDQERRNIFEQTDDAVEYTRVLGPEVFSTNWNHVDQIIIPPGSSTDPRTLKGMEEVYYVMEGSGSLAIDGAATSIKRDDAFWATMEETVSIANNGSEDLKVLIIGIAADKQKAEISYPDAIVLQMDFVVPAENHKEFEEMYHSIYVPAMKVQEGYLSSRLLRLYPDEVAERIQAIPTEFNYQIQISYDTEANRRSWELSDQHNIAWPAATSLVEEFKWRGYDVMGRDDNN
jgi:mannose-6-phosphate isomerase-like protein (cupin superfamily)